MAQPCSLAAFLQEPLPLLDVRSPAEFEQGHIPGAINLPLFSNAERAAVGTCYKQQGHHAAVDLGLTLAGPKLVQIVQQARAIAPDHQVRLHCWRGGLRSSSVAWLLETAGFQVSLLEGGYKAFRRWAHQALSEPRPLWIVGGMTGTGKTETLLALRELGESVIDLEGLANHRGSSYGNLGLPPQPSTEHYENLLAMQWSSLPGDRPVWIEAESFRVGTCRIPQELFRQMEAAPVLELYRPLAERVTSLERLYGSADPGALISATQRIRKRLGGQRTQTAIEAIDRGDLKPAIEVVLDYYDRTYRYDLDRRSVPRTSVDVTGLTPQEAAVKLLDQAAIQTLPMVGGKRLQTQPCSLIEAT
jgi:tRNA 2-selenouridine synthase